MCDWHAEPNRRRDLWLPSSPRLFRAGNVHTSDQKQSACCCVPVHVLEYCQKEIGQEQPVTLVSLSSQVRRGWPKHLLPALRSHSVVAVQRLSATRRHGEMSCPGCARARGWEPCLGVPKKVVSEPSSPRAPLQANISISPQEKTRAKGA